MPDIPPERPTTPSVRDLDLEALQQKSERKEFSLGPARDPIVEMICRCIQIMRDDPTRHFKGCPKREERVRVHERPTFSSIYMRLAEAMAERSTCARLHVGCVIVTPDYRKVLSVGYNGNVSGGNNDCDRHGEEAVGNCGCIHAEQNAVINCDAPRSTPKIVYCTNLPCVMCAKFLINLGNVEKVTYKHDYRIKDALQLFDMHGIKYLHTP